ncbi:hypothetical protein ISO36_17000, partial [Morganella morganii subsp. morganii]|nr:hypothetical protein [Morganella morganii subsp. morganii]
MTEKYEVTATKKDGTTYHGLTTTVEAKGQADDNTEAILDELSGQTGRDQLAQDLLGEINSKAEQSAVMALNNQIKANHDAI